MGYWREIESREGNDIDFVLEAICKPPVVFHPHWTDGMAVAFVDIDNGRLRAGVAFDRDTMLKLRRAGRVWFCDIPIDSLCEVTTAAREWFK
jgi:hypothetical protein